MWLGTRVLSGEQSVETQGMFGETFENWHRKWTSKVASEQGAQSEVAFPINVACIKHIRYNIDHSRLRRALPANTLNFPIVSWLCL